MVKLLIHDFLDNLVQARKVGLGNLAVRAHLDALGAQGIGYQRGKEHDRHLVQGRIFPNLAGQGMASISGISISEMTRSTISDTSGP